LAVESDWVGAAAFAEFSRLKLSQPEVNLGKRARGALLSSMPKAMSMITGHDFKDGPVHQMMSEVGHKMCVVGWLGRMLDIAAPVIGKVIQDEIGGEKMQNAEYVFELFYRHFFLYPNKFHYRYGKVFAAMHGYKIQIWTRKSESQYSLVESYGSGKSVSRWFVQNLTETPSRIDLLIESRATGGHRPGLRQLLSDRMEVELWAQMVQALEVADSEWEVEGCELSSATLLQLVGGGMVPASVILIWSRLCQRINSHQYIQSSKAQDRIESVWFLPPSFLESILKIEEGVIMGYDVADGC
jgi:hypothetical protein